MSGAIVALAVAGMPAPVSATPVGNPNASVADDNSAPSSINAAAALAATGDGAGVSGARGDGKRHYSKAAPAGDTGTISTESIIGTDERTRVNPTTTFPSSAIVQILRTTGGSTSLCSGWLYGASIVATAGHCVHPGSGGNGGGGNGFYPRADYTIIPARNGNSQPFGTCAASQLMSVTGWTQNGNEGNDYGAIRLNCTVGNNTGWFGLWWQSASLAGTATTVSGYPGDKTFGEQWRHAGMTVTNSQTNQVFYKNDTFGGQSGSPVYQTRASGSSFCTGQCAMAIHAYGLHGSAPHSTDNHGTRITEAVFNNLISWRG